MPIIIPYEKEIIQEEGFGPEGAFVLPNGEIRIVSTFPEDANHYINNHLNEEQKVFMGEMGGYIPIRSLVSYRCF